MKDEIDNIIRNKDWSFTDITNLKDTIGGIFMELDGQLSGNQKLDLVWDSDVTFDGNFGERFNELVKLKLSAEIAERITVLLKEAKVVFKSNSIVESKEDGTNGTPESVEVSTDGKEVKTRVGNVKVNRV